MQNKSQLSWTAQCSVWRIMCCKQRLCDKLAMVGLSWQHLWWSMCHKKAENWLNSDFGIRFRREVSLFLEIHELPYKTTQDKAKTSLIHLDISIEHLFVTDRQTDTLTDRQTLSPSIYHSVHLLCICITCENLSEDVSTLLDVPTESLCSTDNSAYLCFLRVCVRALTLPVH